MTYHILHPSLTSSINGTGCNEIYWGIRPAMMSWSACLDGCPCVSCTVQTVKLSNFKRGCFDICMATTLLKWCLVSWKCNLWYIIILLIKTTWNTWFYFMSTFHLHHMHFDILYFIQLKLFYYSTLILEHQESNIFISYYWINFQFQIWCWYNLMVAIFVYTFHFFVATINALSRSGYEW